MRTGSVVEPDGVADVSQDAGHAYRDCRTKAEWSVEHEQHRAIEAFGLIPESDEAGVILRRAPSLNRKGREPLQEVEEGDLSRD